jgi:glycosyltransferase involved in cell wall biosynthesis
VIVVDDGSSDASPAIARKFGDAVRFFPVSHRGGNGARNEILRQARGEWLQFLDADDYLLPEKISMQFEDAGTAEAGVLYSPVWIEQDSAREASPMDVRLDLYSLWMSWQLPQTGGCLWRKSALESLNGWNEAMPCCQEHELYLRALKAGKRFHFAPTPNAVYRIWSEETVCRRDPRQVIRIRTELIDDLRAWMESQNLWRDEHREVAARACFEMARTWAKYDLAEARAYHSARKRRNLIQPDGPAAPPAYKFTYRALGFFMAEKLAGAMR